MTDICSLTWSNEHLDDALVMLAKRAAIGRAVSVDKLHWDAGIDLATRLAEVACACQLETEQVSVGLGELKRALRAMAPALLSPPGQDHSAVLLKADWRGPILLDCHGDVRRCSWRELEAWLGAPIAARIERRIGGVLKVMGSDLNLRGRKRLVETMATAQPFGIGWMVRESEGLADGLGDVLRRSHGPIEVHGTILPGVARGDDDTGHRGIRSFSSRSPRSSRW